MVLQFGVLKTNSERILTKSEQRRGISVRLFLDKIRLYKSKKEWNFILTELTCFFKLGQFPLIIFTFIKNMNNVKMLKSFDFLCWSLFESLLIFSNPILCFTVAALCMIWLSYYLFWLLTEDYFSNTPSSDQTIYTNSSYKHFVCPRNCGRRYKHKTHLNNHLRYECGVPKQFKCHLCCKECSRKASLQLHLINKHKVL